MTKTIQTVMEKMIALYAGDARRIQHFTKVYAYAALLGRQEGLNAQTQETLELAALTHDIGIHACEQKYGNTNGKAQEQEGPALAQPLLAAAGVPAAQCRRVCFLIAHHHTYTDVDGADWQLLLEADFLVNGLEDELPPTALATGLANVFRTASGKALCAQMFGLRQTP